MVEIACSGCCMINTMFILAVGEIVISGFNGL